MINLKMNLNNIGDQLLNCMGAMEIEVKLGTTFDENLFDRTNIELNKGGPKGEITNVTRKGYRSELADRIHRKPGVVVSS
jgi:molecular chaperone GrpE (heat shock protein)